MLTRWQNRENLVKFFLNVLAIWRSPAGACWSETRIQGVTPVAVSATVVGFVTMAPKSIIRHKRHTVDLPITGLSITYSLLPITCRTPA